MELTHFNDEGRAHMVDVGEKPRTKRVARAMSRVYLAPETFRLVRDGGMKKGDVLSVAQGDLLALLLALVGTIVCWVFLFNPLLITSVNAPLAQSRGIRSRMTEYAFTMLVAVAVMVSIRWVGVMLINSLLILPAAASRNVARSAAGYMRTSVIIALCCGVIGLALSYYLNTSAGAAIVLCCAAVYFVTLPMRRK